MKTYDTTKTTEIANPDLTKGCLKPDKLLARTEPPVAAAAEQGHYETIREYPSGGKDVKWVVDVPGAQAKEAENIYEDIQVYFPYTDQQLKDIRADQIKDRLASLSQDMIQSAAGEILPDIALRKDEFVQLHNELRALQGKAPRAVAQ